MFCFPSGVQNKMKTKIPIGKCGLLKAVATGNNIIMHYLLPTASQSPDESQPGLFSMPSDLRISDAPVLLR